MGAFHERQVMHIRMQHGGFVFHHRNLSLHLVFLRPAKFFHTRAGGYYCFTRQQTVLSSASIAATAAQHVNLLVLSNFFLYYPIHSGHIVVSFTHPLPDRSPLTIHGVRSRKARSRGTPAHCTLRASFAVAQVVLPAASKNSPALCRLPAYLFTRVKELWREIDSGSRGLVGSIHFHHVRISSVSCLGERRR